MEEEELWVITLNRTIKELKDKKLTCEEICVEISKYYIISDLEGFKKLISK